MDLLTSKKFQMTVVGIVVIFVGHMIPEINKAALTEVVAVIVAYLIGQGLADFGKEKELTKAAIKMVENEE